MAVNLERLDRLCKDDAVKKQRYLRRFLELVPPGIGQIQAGLRANDGQAVRQAVHFLAPQLVFFGIDDFTQILETLGAQPDRTRLHDLHQTIEQAVDKVSQAATEVQHILNDLDP